MLRWRLIGATAILVPLIMLLWVDYNYCGERPGICLLPVALLVVGLASGELLRLFGAKGYHPAAWPVVVGNLVLVLAASAPIAWRDYPDDSPLGKLGWVTLGLAAATVLVLVYEMRRYEKPERVVERLSFSLATFCLLGVLFGFVIQLRLLGGNEVGLVALLSMVIAVKLADVGAYTAGRLFGRHKMVPVLSPGKTWEGAAGGVLFAMAASWAVFKYLAPWLAPEANWELPLWAPLIYGFLMMVAGACGDLMISLIKRDVGLKDSASWLPGLGGFLDVIDSLLLGAPVAYVCWVCGLLGPK